MLKFIKMNKEEWLELIIKKMSTLMLSCRVEFRFKEEDLSIKECQ